eukprot:c27589_g1_i1.p1 GENE.c27589_g1_i1~~c27589_g1_i1.p1  ORF type:complete len:600 (+),score=96.59 c27589_g1_i1:86-1801(+)
MAGYTLGFAAFAVGSLATLMSAETPFGRSSDEGEDRRTLLLSLCFFGLYSIVLRQLQALPTVIVSRAALAGSLVAVLELVLFHSVLAEAHDPKGILRSGPGIIRFVYTSFKWWAVAAQVAIWRVPPIGTAQVRTLGLYLTLTVVKYGFMALAVMAPKVANAIATLLAGWLLIKTAQLGVVDYVMGLMAMVGRDGFFAAVHAIVRTVVRLSETFFLYFFGVVFAATFATVTFLQFTHWSLGMAGLSLLLTLVPSTACALCGLSLFHALVTSALTGLTYVFAPAFVREIGEHSNEYPHLQSQVRARHLGMTMAFIVVVIQPFGDEARVYEYLGMILLYLGLDVMYVLAEVAAHILLCISSQSTSRLQHARALVFFIGVAAFNIGGMIAFLRATDGFSYLVFYLMDTWCRGIVRLAKHFALYLVQQLSAIEHVESRVYAIELTASVLDVLLKVAFIAGSLRMSAGSSNMWLLMYAVQTVKGIQASWRVFMARRAAAAQFDESVRNATATELAAHNDVCAFCMEAMAVGSAKTLRCRHIFHSVCIQRWLAVQNSCPTCRMAVLDDGTGGAAAPQH